MSLLVSLFPEMRLSKIHCLNPHEDEQALMSYRRAKYLVDCGYAVFVIGEAGVQQVRYLLDFERKESLIADQDRWFEVVTESSCSNRMWKKRHSGKLPVVGGPKCRVRQFV